MAGLNAKFVLLKDTVSIHDPGHGDNPDGILLPAGCLVQEISESDDPATDQLLLQSLDHATGGSFFIHASLDDLLEVSAFSSSLLLAEKELKMRLIVCRDENWLEEATHMFEDTNVFVSVGRAQFLGVIRFAGEMEDRVGRWFGVEIQSSLLVNVENMVGGGDGFPEFECEFGRGLYVTISSVRLAEPVLDMPFRGRAAGKKGFSARTLRAAGSKKMKMDSRAQQNEKENGGVKSDQNVVNGFLDFEWKNERGLEVDDRVVWFGSQDGPARGTVRYIGRINSKDEKIRISVEFDEKVGDENYTGMTNGFGQFSIKSGYGRLLDPNEVMNEVDFGYEQTIHSRSETEKKSSKNESKISTTENNPEQSALTIGTRVVWFKTKDDPVRGKVCFLGKVDGKKSAAEKVGVRLDMCKGPNNFTGKHKGKDSFHCGPGYGVLTDMESLMSEAEYDVAFGLSVNCQSAESDASQLKVKDKIVWIDPKDENKTPQYGTVLFMGEVNGMNGIQLGVEFDNPCGQKDWTGKFKKKQWFTCKPNHGRFIPRDENSWFRQENFEGNKKELETETEPTAEMETKNVSPVKPIDQSHNISSDLAATEAQMQSNDSPFTTVKTIKNFSIGDRVFVQLKNERKIGMIRWMGVISTFTKENLVGLEMDDLIGSPDNVTHCGFAGNAQRGYVEVFQCKAGHGTFAKPEDLNSFGEADVQETEDGDEVSWTKVGPHKKFESSRPPRFHESIRVDSVPLQTSPIVPINVQTPFRPPSVNQLAPSTVNLRAQRFQTNLQIGQKVFTFFGPDSVMGIVKWIGFPHFAPIELHVGLQLLQYMEGVPGGAIDGFEYFDALAGFGVIIPLDAVHPIGPPINPPFLNGFPPLRPNDQQGAHFNFRLENLHKNSKSQNQIFDSFATRSVQPPVTESTTEPIHPPEHVLRALREADLKEKATIERINHVAVFALQAEDHGEFSVTVDDKDRTKGFVIFLLRPPPESEPYQYRVIRVTTPEINGNVDGQIGNFDGVPKKTAKNIEFFPPFFLRFHLTEGFPEHLPPVYSVNCNWITDVQVNKLREHLIGIWRESLDHPERNILFESMRQLKTSLLKIMGLEFGIVYINKAVAEFEVDDSHLPAGRCLYETDKEVMEVFSRLAKFNDKECKDRDEKDKIECSICTCAVSPSEISFFSTLCTHEQMFCKDCISNHVKAQVENGNTGEIKCMGDGCQVLSTIHDLADLINRDVFEVMSPQLNSRLLDNMPDIRRCPACGHAVIFDHTMIGNERYITCPSEDCGIQYCPHCKGKSHGEQPCLSAEKKRELRNQFLGAATQEEKDELIKQYGKENIDHAIEDYDAEEYIRTHGKPCPSCKSPTEKIEGCNRMTCTVCNTNFCYICGAELPKSDPYQHFNNGTCAKFDR